VGTRIEIPIPQPEQPELAFEFVDGKDGLLEFQAESLEAHIAAFRAVNSGIDDHYWSQAAVAASVSKKYGQGEMEKMAEAVERSPSYLRQIARTYRTFTENFSREKDLSFNHHRIACYHPNPTAALTVAKEQGMSCRALETWVSEQGAKRAKRATSKAKQQVKSDFLVHLEHVEQVIEDDFLVNCPIRDFANRVYKEWLSQIKFELRQMLRGANQEKIRAAINDEGAATLKQIKELTGLALSDVEAAVGQMVAQNEYEWIKKSGKMDDQRGTAEMILHKVGEPDGGAYNVARPVNQYAH